MSENNRTIDQRFWDWVDDCPTGVYVNHDFTDDEDNQKIYVFGFAVPKKLKFSVLFFLDHPHSIYELVEAPDADAAVEVALKEHGWNDGDTYSVELVLEGHHSDARGMRYA
jgi:hypothetical protein